MGLGLYRPWLGRVNSGARHVNTIVRGPNLLANISTLICTSRSVVLNSWEKVRCVRHEYDTKELRKEKKETA